MQSGNNSTYNSGVESSQDLDLRVEAYLQEQLSSTSPTPNNVDIVSSILETNKQAKSLVGSVTGSLVGSVTSDWCPVESSPHIVPPLGPNERVVTIYLCGTCSNRSDLTNRNYFEGENVSHTYDITEGEEYVDKIIVDGPGSGELDANDLWVDYTPHWQLYGMALGAGISERIDHIIAVLKNKPTRNNSPLSDKALAGHARLTEINQDSRIGRINIVGWSRGAAAGITLAHRLYGDIDLRDIPVNLVLLDPVPGEGASRLFTNELARNVLNYFCLYAEDERSIFFNTVIPKPGRQDCRYVAIAMPGGHAQVAGCDKDHDGLPIGDYNLQGVGKIARYLIERELQSFGTKLDQSKLSTLTAKQALGLFDDIKINRDGYKQAGTLAPYVGLNQLLGRQRKVITTTGMLSTMTYFSDAREKMFTAHHGDYVNDIHQTYAMTYGDALQFGEYVLEKLQDFDEMNQVVDEQYINDVLDSLFDRFNHQHRDQTPLFYKTVSEIIQQARKPADLDNLAHRYNNAAGLRGYVKALMQEKVAEKIQAIIREQAAAAEAAAREAAEAAAREAAEAAARAEARVIARAEARVIARAEARVIARAEALMEEYTREQVDIEDAIAKAKSENSPKNLELIGILKEQMNRIKGEWKLRRFKTSEDKTACKLRYLQAHIAAIEKNLHIDAQTHCRDLLNDERVYQNRRRSGLFGIFGLFPGAKTSTTEKALVQFGKKLGLDAPSLPLGQRKP